MRHRRTYHYADRDGRVLGPFDSREVAEWQVDWARRVAVETYGNHDDRAHVDMPIWSVKL